MHLVVSKGFGHSSPGQLHITDHQLAPSFITLDDVDKAASLYIGFLRTVVSDG
jgi:hypothetical protein